MDRVQLLLLGLPLFLFCSDILNLFAPPPPKPSHHHHNHAHHHHTPQPGIQQPLDFPIETPPTIHHTGIGIGSTVNINFCASCSYRGNAVTMQKMLEDSFPGIQVILANHPAPLPKRLLSKLVPVFQVGVMGIVMAGEHIFPRLGFMTPPAWYFSLRQNRFGTIATTMLLGNVMQSFLQSSGAFEVFYNDELVFSKLKEHRFPGEVELRELVTRKLAHLKNMDPTVW